MAVSRRECLERALAAGAAGTVAALPTAAQARERVTPLPFAVGLLYDSTRCVGCGGCVSACKEANQLPWDAPKELSNTTKTLVKRRSLPVADGAPAASAFSKQQCMHCVDPSCVSVCMMGALHKEGEGKRDTGGERRGTGIVLYDKDLCLGCRYCQIACAFSVPKFEWRERVPRIVKCELCHHRRDPAQEGPLGVANPACAQVCPTGAVIYGLRAELLAEAKRRQAEEPQRYNPKVFGETEGGGAQVLTLAARGVTFRQLGFPDLPDYAPAYLSESVSHAPYLHGLTPLLLYAAAAFVIRRNKDQQEQKGHEEGH